MNLFDNNTAGENPKEDIQKMSSLLKRGFSIILILILFLAVLNIFQLQKTRQQLNDVVSTNIEKMALGSIMRDLIRLRTISLYKMLEIHDYFKRDKEVSQFYSYSKRYREARDKTTALGVTEIEEKLNQEILTQIRVAEPLAQDAAENMLSNIPNAQLQLKVSKAIKSQDKLYQLLNQLNTLQETQANQALKDVNRNFLYTIILTSLVTLIVIYLIIKIAVRLYRHVINTSNILAYKNIDLEQAYNKAEESTKIKTEFLAKMSHEIRTPMNGVMGMLQLLMITDITEEQKDYVETALSSSNDLLVVIENILDFSKMESGKLNIEKTPFNLFSIVDDIVNTYEKIAQDKNIELSSSLHADVNEQYIGDHIRISQILMNLVDNAIKFTKEGKVSITVSIHEKYPTSTLLCFEVRDSGAGVSDENKERLFTAFNQLDNSIERPYDGTGLGLSICKSLVSLMDGEIGIQDAKDSGSVFWFTLKLEDLNTK